MTDFIKLILKAGTGGRGKVSFRREKYAPKGGPDGGDGGDGGSIILKADRALSTLKNFAGHSEYEATPGDPGDKRKKTGAKGSDLILRVPVGTQVTILAENGVARRRRMELGMANVRRRSEVRCKIYHTSWEADAHLGQPSVHFDKSEEDLEEMQAPAEQILLSEDGQELVVCQGGFGGRGNVAFKGSTRTTPLLAELGSAAEVREVELELKLLADVGLVGLPNAGKSTLLSVLTKAKPKIASYPFTTLEPNLGLTTILRGSSTKEIVIADIPGLIEGANIGKGLGHDFLRHIENCQSLLFLLFLEESVIFDQSSTNQEKAQMLIDQHAVLTNELNSHSSEMIKKKQLIAISKSDLLEKDLQKTIASEFVKNNLGEPVFISSATLDGVDQLKSRLA